MLVQIFVVYFVLSILFPKGKKILNHDVCDGMSRECLYPTHTHVPQVGLYCIMRKSWLLYLLEQLPNLW